MVIIKAIKKKKAARVTHYFQSCSFSGNHIWTQQLIIPIVVLFQPPHPPETGKPLGSDTQPQSRRMEANTPNTHGHQIIPMGYLLPCY